MTAVGGPSDDVVPPNRFTNQDFKTTKTPQKEARDSTQQSAKEYATKNLPTKNLPLIDKLFCVFDFGLDL